MSFLIGAPSMGVSATAKAVKCDRCKTPVRNLQGVHSRRLGLRRKPGWAMVCAECFEQLGRPDDPVRWT